ncbi:MAG: GMC family oxidoreductase N-terminal domain-containing protein [Bacteroidota bacterium]
MFDYIIVGAGSAGCVLANRLSEDPNTSVLLVEAGKKDSKPEIHIPAAFSKCFKTEVDWALETVEQPHAGGRKLFLPRGKVMGGSSSINAMIYIRGNKAEYDEWASLGNNGWDYDSLLPYFKKSEHFESGGESDYHGENGLLNVASLREPFPVSKAFVEAGKELGYETNPDFNGEKQEGFGLYHVNQKNGKRLSAARAFIKPIEKRKNLTVLTQCQVKQILIEDKKAVGIVYQTKTHLQEVMAAKEVIVAAGAYHSPQLLMVSGIGPAEELQANGIPVKHTLEGVGKNLIDHVIVPLVLKNRDKHSLDRADQVPANFVKFLVWGEGPLSSNVAEAGAFIHTKEGLEAPDIQYHFGPAYFRNHGFDLLKKGRGFSIGPTLLRPESMGHISLNGADMANAPLIDHAYLEKQADVDTLVAGMQLAVKLATSKAMSSFFGGYYFPENIEKARENWGTYVRQNAQTLYHPVGTCKMGIDSMAVVDDQLRVHGIENLRVVDASIMPTIPRGNTHAPVVAIAEKAADLIKSKQTSTVLVAENS